MVTGAGNIAEATQLWRQAFHDEGSDPQVSRLVNSLRGIREKVQQLTTRIAASLPGLTIHDVSHLDGLWRVASTIAGPTYSLNPLEAYIFGAAVLLHDSGLCFEAYSGGQPALRDTLEWRDARGLQNWIGGNQSELEIEADFAALRALHATQAGNLATQPWRTRGHEIFLIDDQDLREHYGPLIGQIASSHHWNLEHVQSRFENPRPAAAFLTEDWVVDSLKIACLLRVADAGHLDSSRAPSFLLRVLQMNSVSRSHWIAQNKLGRLTTRPGNPTQLMIASTAPFEREESSAWWVAYDLIGVFDRELRQCNALLETDTANSSRAFKSKRVAGVDQIREFVKFVEADGWEPADFAVHVSDVAALIGKLGGEQLYGATSDHLNIALRELIQNAADAVGIRKSLPNGNGFAGEITVRLLEGNGGGWRIQVDDNGVGMSRRTLTTELLDFGQSFWVKERAAREFPGVHSAGYKPIGRFGIGFFSIFMAANKVNVYSRKFNEALGAARRLEFANGLSLRPTLSSEIPSDMGMGVCTRVEIDLKPGILVDPDQMTITCNLQGQQDFEVPFEAYVAAIVAGIEFPVIVERLNDRFSVHDGFPPEPQDREKWLRKLSFIEGGVNHRSQTGLAHALPRLREIWDGEKCFGLAAVNVLRRQGGVFLSSKAVGGLVNPHAGFDDSFVGLMDYMPAGAQRGPGLMAAPKACIDQWVSEQLQLLCDTSLSNLESLYASYSICDLGVRPDKHHARSVGVIGKRTGICPVECSRRRPKTKRSACFPNIAGNRRTLGSVRRKIGIAGSFSLLHSQQR